MFYLIYKVTNIVNNKIYIGKHKTRNKEDGYMGSGKVLKRAQEKYGIDKFKFEIIYELSSEEEMNKMEEKIVDLDFILREDTYNLKIGGSGGWEYCNLPENHNNKNNYRRIGFLKHIDLGLESPNKEC